MGRYTCYDHLGNEFASKSEMCKHYKISKSVFNSRLRSGWTLEKTLTTPVVSRKMTDKEFIYDHLGNKFSTIKDLCDYHNISRNLYNKRKSLGWTLEEILTSPVGAKYSHISNSVTDHLGNIYLSLREMCDFYKIPRRVYTKRLYDLGWNQKDALTKPIHPKVKVYDHFGNEFSSLSEMLGYYNIPKRRYYSCLEKGLSLEEILENRFLKVFEDHLGNKFVSKSAMLNHYGANKSNYNNRIKKTSNLKYALTGDK